MKKIILFAIAVMLIGMAALFAGNTGMREGKWEISMTMDMKGLPYQMPPMNYTQCVTKKDVESNKNAVPASGDKNNDCVVKDYKVKGNTVTWKTKCKDGTEGSGEITYSGDSYEGTITMDVKDKSGSKSTMTNKIKGKRAGDC